MFRVHFDLYISFFAQHLFNFFLDFVDLSISNIADSDTNESILIRVAGVPLSYDARSVFSLFSMKYMGSWPLNRKELPVPDLYFEYRKTG